ncbi:MAG: hypothetical protein J6V90_08105 [Treponema sp.]|nr:hypothetical protein [Treponema sp.]
MAKQLWHTRLNNIYRNMKMRCYNPKNPAYENYGGRGIVVCDEWKERYAGYKRFKEWALSNGYQEDLTIDRINNDKGYSPDNCKWVSMKVQQRNKRNTFFVIYKGKTKPLILWCEELGLSYNRIRARLEVLKWSVKKALETR